ncbi:hypothetical protein [Paraburkholderia heleia]|uniref:hypothetical protein n=1 Tax=Paraburkholderia heleia TaxID=634127 RepID=UPI000693B439|nr:hypothetical protein [Paraburkholderia heleia]
MQLVHAREAIMWNARRLLTIVVMTLLCAAASGVHAGGLDRSVTKSDLTVHFGVVPAENAQAVERGASAPADTQAGSASSYHLVVALFDKSSGKRVDNVIVTAKVIGPAHSAHKQTQVKPLQELRINDTVTYGNYFDMSWEGHYRIDLSIQRKDQTEPTRIRLAYDHRF